MPGHMDVTAKDANLQTLAERLKGGESVVLTEGGRVIGQAGPSGEDAPWDSLSPQEKAIRRQRLVGLYAGQFAIPEDFYDPLPEELADPADDRTPGDDRR